MTAPKIRVMLADDDPGFLAALGDTVASASDLEVVGTASDAAQAAAAAADLHPDVVVMDVRMSGGGGVIAAQDVARNVPGTRVVALSAHEDRASPQRMLEAGAGAYGVKGPPEAAHIE